MTRHANTIDVRAVIMDDAPTPRDVAELAAALEWYAGVIAGPAVEPYPHPEASAHGHEAWQAMRCRSGSRHCRCDWCAWEKHNRPIVENWQRSQTSHRLSPKQPAAFGSAADALTQWAGWRRDGHAARSSLGATLDRGKERAVLGVSPAASRGVSREPRPIYEAGLSVDVERAMLRTYEPEQARQGMPTWSAIAVLCASVTEERWTPEHEAERRGVPTSDVRAVVRMGRRGVTVELAARDMVPQPSRPRTLLEAIRARRAELETA